MKKNQITGVIITILIISFASIYLKSSIIFFRFMIGIGIGYILTRGFLGFAGGPNRAYTFGSARLMTVLMWMFMGAAILNIAFLYNLDTGFEKAIHPINLPLVIGAWLFGFGMSASLCCASGALTDIVTSPPRGIITILFFFAGVFLGFPIQHTSWVKETLISTRVTEKNRFGVYLPDLFKWDGLHGFLGATVVMVFLSAIVIYIFKKYEAKRKAENTYIPVPSEVAQYQNSLEVAKRDVEVTVSSELNKDESKIQTIYNDLFVKPWSLERASLMFILVTALLVGGAKTVWGVTSSFGIWFGKILMLFGATPEGLSEFTKRKVTDFSTPFFDHASSVQNLGIALGTVICLLLAGTFFKTVSGDLKITFKEMLIYAVGGFSMGFGTRLANGCNAGALFSPISHYSFSAWIFLVFMIIGTIMSKKLLDKIQ